MPHFSLEGNAQCPPQGKGFMFSTVTHFPDDVTRGCCRFSCCLEIVPFNIDTHSLLPDLKGYENTAQLKATTAQLQQINELNVA